MKVNLYEKLIELSKSDVSIVIFKNGIQESIEIRQEQIAYQSDGFRKNAGRKLHNGQQA